MPLVPYKVVEKILLEIPNATINEKWSNLVKVYFNINGVIISVETKGVDVDYFMDILSNQLDMSWWMIDYIFGENKIVA
ncbi:MAG: hypothetical protein AAF348_17895 [Bacteroidota bacterium]